MADSVVAQNSAAAASGVELKPKEVALPVYADDLADNVRAGFDSTCVYIKDCSDALEERLNKKLDAITSRLDALTDAVANQQARVDPPAAPLRGAHAHDDLEDDAAYAPRQLRFDPRQAPAARVPPADRGGTRAAGA